VLGETPLKGPVEGVPPPGSVILTSARGNASESVGAYAAMGFANPFSSTCRFRDKPEALAPPLQFRDRLAAHCVSA
jgi:hypothetical protein